MPLSPCAAQVAAAGDHKPPLLPSRVCGHLLVPLLSRLNEEVHSSLSAPKCPSIVPWEVPKHCPVGRAQTRSLLTKSGKRSLHTFNPCGTEDYGDDG